MNPEYVALILAAAQQLLQLASDLHSGKTTPVEAAKVLDQIPVLHEQLVAQDKAADAAADEKFGK